MNHTIKLKQIDEICNKWLFKKSDFLKLDSFYNHLKHTDFTSLISAFRKRLDEVPYKFTKSETVSGSICFYGAVFTSLLNTGKIEQIEGLFTFALCYMLIDHFLDDVNNTDLEKKKNMKEVYEFLLLDNGSKDDSKDNNSNISNNILINSAKERYLKLIEISGVKQALISLFKSEIKGAKISNDKNLNREEYKQIAKEKGGKTSLAIATIIGINIDGKVQNSPHYICGSLIQYVDDILDIKDDENLGIYTLARYDIEHTDLDQYVYDVILEIENLGSIYNFFKPILLMGIILGIHDNPNSVSKELLNALVKYDSFGEYTKDSLNNWFHNKLYEYIEENI